MSHQREHQLKKLPLLIAFVLTNLLLAAGASQAVAAPIPPVQPSLVKPKKVCSLATPCPGFLELFASPQACTSKLRRQGLSSSHNDCDARICAAAGARAAFYYSSISGPPKLAISPSLGGMVASTFADIMYRASMAGAYHQEYSNNVLWCGNRVSRTTTVILNATWNDPFNKWYEIFNRGEPKFVLGFSGGGLKPPKRAVGKLLHRFANNINIGGTDRFGNWRLDSRMSATGNIGLTISVR